MPKKLKITSVFAVDKGKLKPYWLVYFNRSFEDNDFNALKSIAIPADFME